MGGKTPEHEISLISGREVVRNLDSKKYEIIPIVISRNGKKWQLVSSEKLLSLPDPLSIKDSREDLVKRPDKNMDGINQLAVDIDVVFIAMHGPFGEDGTIQGTLELAGVTYTGPGVLASALGMDKLMFRNILKSADIIYPKFVALKKDEGFSKVFKSLGVPPYFVKPRNQGSSLGNSLVKNRKELKKAVEKALEFSPIILVDEYIEGTEVTCGIIGNEEPHALPLVEIKPLKSEFFDYESKYTESGAEEIVPARVSEKLTKQVQELAVEVYKLLGCRGFSRVDFILKNNKLPYVLEINTIPGLTPMSLLPKAANAYGLNYSKFLDKIITYSIEDR